MKCEANAYDNKQYCRCPPGERISRFKSRHNNHHEDRIWDLECQGIPAYGPNGEMYVSFALSLGPLSKISTQES